MKIQLKMAWGLLLLALVVSLISAAVFPGRAFAARCDLAGFVPKGETPLDGASFAPNTAFDKTWILKNIGTCTWTTNYSLVFDRGDQMGGSTPFKFSSNVGPNDTVKLTVPLTAPATPGHYKGFWKLKNAEGVLFGIGSTVDGDFWVDINVVVGGGGTTTGDIVYDFTAHAADTGANGVEWSSGAGSFTFPGTEGNASGFALKLDKPIFEDGKDTYGSGLLFVPNNTTANHFVQAIYPPFMVQSGDRFKSQIGCQSGATACYAAYLLQYQTVDSNGVSSGVKTLWRVYYSQDRPFIEKYDRLTYPVNQDLSSLAGKNVRFILKVSAYGSGSPIGDRALWGNPVIVRKGSSPPPPPPSGNAAYDFAAHACDEGKWFSGASSNQPLPCPGTDGDAKGFVLKVTNPKLETGAVDTRPGILTFPSPRQNNQDGYIQGFFPPFKVQSGDRFRSIINCEGGATNCYAAFRLDYVVGSDPIKPFWGPFLEKRDQPNPLYYSMDVDLSSLAGKDVKFILTVLSAGVETGDRALWVGPIIFRPGSSSALPDLTITQIKIELQNTSCLESSASLGTRVWVTNSGQGPAASFIVKVNDAQQTVNGLAVGETKPVFFAGSSNPVTAIVDPGGAIAESNEQNNSRSETVPVPTPPIPCTPAPAGNIYQNTKYNFKFTLPTGATIASQSDTIGRVDLPISAGTNLREKYIQVNVSEGTNPCVSPDVGGAASSSENVTINNIQFLKQTGQQGAAGNSYDLVAYSTTRNNACIILTFILHSVNPGNFPTPPPVFDKAGESAVFTSTMSTFNWITP